MSKVDGRKVSHDLREAIRIQAIQKWLDGAKVQRLSKEYGTDSSCIYRWISRYRAGGMDALKTRPIAHSKNSKLIPIEFSNYCITAQSREHRLNSRPASLQRLFQASQQQSTIFS